MDDKSFQRYLEVKIDVCITLCQCSDLCSASRDWFTQTLY